MIPRHSYLLCAVEPAFEPSTSSTVSQRLLACWSSLYGIKLPFQAWTFISTVSIIRARLSDSPCLFQPRGARISEAASAHLFAKPGAPMSHLADQSPRHFGKSYGYLARRPGAVLIVHAGRVASSFTAQSRMRSGVVHQPRTVTAHLVPQANRTLNGRTARFTMVSACFMLHCRWRLTMSRYHAPT